MSLKTKIALAFAIVYIVWGSTYLAIRIGLETMPPLLMAAVRFLVAGTLLKLWCDWRGEPKATRGQMGKAAVVGLLLVTLGNGLVTIAEQSVPSGIAAVIVAIGPVFTTLLAWSRGLQSRPGPSTALGLILGLAGVGLLVLGGEGGRIDPLGAGLIIAATFSWSCGVLYSQANELPESNLRSNSIQMLSGGATMAVLGLGSGEAGRVHLERISLASGLALAYLILFGAILAYSAYAWLLRNVSATIAGTTAYVNPAVAVLLGTLWGEKLDTKALLAMGTIFVGVWLIKRQPQELTAERA